jgi:hypothetical protein
VNGPRPRFPSPLPPEGREGRAGGRTESAPRGSSDRRRGSSDRRRERRQRVCVVERVRGVWGRGAGRQAGVSGCRSFIPRTRA